jgi:hypothetical protein
MRPALCIFLQFAIAGALALLLPSSSFGQLPPTYEEFTRDPLPNYQLTPNDLPNLGRLVVLEATSMYVHASDELFDSPAGRQLIDDIAGVWIAADAFTAAVWFDPADPRIAEAGMLSLPDLQAAFERLRATMQIVPGRAQVTAQNFRNMSRIMAVIGPILREASDAQAAVEPPLPTPGDPADLRDRSAALSSAIQSMSGPTERDGAGIDLPVRLKGQLELLDRLARGFSAVLADEPDERDAVSSFRPVRTLATAIDTDVSRSGYPAAIRDRWKNVQSRVDELAGIFQLPRTIVVAPPEDLQVPADEASVKAIDHALREIEPLLLVNAAAPSSQTARDDVADGARRLRTRLLVLSQQLVGREASGRVARSAGGVETARRRLGDRVNQPREERGLKAAERLKSVDDAVAQVRSRLTGR